MAFFDIFKKKQDTPPTGEQAQKQQEELSAGLEKTKTGLFSKLARAVAGRSTIDAGVLDDLEEVLISSDVGVETTVKIIRRIEERVARDKYMNAAELRGILRDEIAALMEQSHASTKDFGLELPEGTPYVLMVVGVNGAGKTTLLKILCGVNRADDGTVDLLGGSPADAATRAKIGVVFEDAFFYGSFNAAQVARSLAGMYGAQWNADSFSAYLRRFGLDAGKKLKEYSRGMRLKLSLAAALAHDPELLVLDEATAGLDPVVRGELLDLFLEFIQDERHSIVMSSHITADLEQIADSIAYLHNGQLLFQENKDDLLQEYGVLHCGEDVLTSLPAGLVVFTRRGAYGCESLVRERRTVQELLPEAVCDAARLDDIMRFFSGRDAQ